MSDRQRALLAAVAEFIETHGYSPALRDLAMACDIPSSSSVVYNLDALERHGLIEREHEVARSIRLTAAGRAALKGGTD
jgi:repressor LexA